MSQLQNIFDMIQSNNIEIVSFDLFDTLLYRPMIKPIDIFRIVEKRSGDSTFTAMRTHAERSAVKTYAGKVLNYDDIYAEMETIYTLSHEKVLKFKSIEKEVEYQYLLPRKTAKLLYDAARRAKKHIVITSDMYLDHVFLEKVLRKNGFQDYKKIYLSCEANASKRDGRLYEIIKNDFELQGIRANQIVHIGDNFEVDIMKAKKYGFHAFHFPKAYDIFQTDPKFSPLSNFLTDTLDNTFLLGFIANIIFDNPFIEFDRDSYFNGRWENCGWIVLGPFLLMFVDWMIKDVIKEKKDKIYFLYRDGYIPQRIYEMLAKYYINIPSTELIYLNRSMQYCFMTKQNEALYRGLLQYPFSKDMKVREFIHERLMVSESLEVHKIFEIMQKYGYASMEEKIGDIKGHPSLCQELNPFFLKNGTKNMEAVRDYCKDKLQESDNPAIFDVGYRGRACCFLKDELDINCTEYQVFARSETEKHVLQGYDIRSMVQRGVEGENNYLIYILLDDVLSIQNPGIKTLEKRNNCVYPIFEESDMFSEEIDRVQNSIINFAQEFSDVFQSDLLTLYFDPYPFFELIKNFFAGPSKRDLGMFEKMRCPNEAAFCGVSNRDEYYKWYTKHLQKMKKNQHGIFYKVAYDVLNKVHILNLIKRVYHRAKRIMTKIF